MNVFLVMACASRSSRASRWGVAGVNLQSHGAVGRLSGSANRGRISARTAAMNVARVRRQPSGVRSCPQSFHGAEG